MLCCEFKDSRNRFGRDIACRIIVFPNCWFDEVECADGLDRLRHYRYRVVEGQLSDEPVHDENSNGADAFMTMGQGIRSPKTKSNLQERLKRATNAFLDDAPMQGWLGQ